DFKPERTSSLSELLNSSEGDIRVEHKSRDFIRQSSRTSSTETMSSGENKNAFSPRKKSCMTSHPPYHHFPKR
ncbi:sterile alpha and TIR motif-containing protein 1, partial [Trichonephila inaurata madagascariensis]